MMDRSPSQKRGSYGLISDPLAISQTVSILTRFIEPPGGGGPGIPRLDFEKELLKVDNPTASDVSRSFRRNLAGKSAPLPAAAWNIGEVIRRFNVPWMNALLMLASSGHVGDAVGITGMWVLQKDDPASYCDRAWHMMALVPTIAASSSLDFVPLMLSQHLRAAYLDPDLAQDLIKRTRHDAVIDGVKVTAQDADVFIARELAKDAWTPYPMYAEEFETIARRWFADPYWRITGRFPDLDVLMEAAVSVGRASDVPLASRQVAVLALFGHALSTIEMERSLYPRPIAKRYFVSEVTPPSEAFESGE